MTFDKIVLPVISALVGIAIGLISMYTFIKAGITEEVTTKVEVATAKAAIVALQNSSYLAQDKLEARISALQTEVRVLSDKLIKIEKENK